MSDLIRFQFEPREGHFLDFQLARITVREHGGQYVKVACPVMVTMENGHRRIWRGVRQPKTLTFSLPSLLEDPEYSADVIANRICEEYGWDKAFVRRREECK